jgi:hypothetical protein
MLSVKRIRFNDFLMLGTAPLDLITLSRLNESLFSGEKLQ